jgi:chromosome partitioning protein
MTTVVFTNQKGGPGKTTLSVLFAHWLVDKQGQRVCVVDLDSQRNASKTLLAFACVTEAVQLFDEAPVTCSSDAALTLVPGSPGLVDIERSAPEQVLPAFRRQLALLAQRFDVVVIDTPPALGLRMSAALIAGTHVVCPIELEEYSIDGVTDMLKSVFGIRQRYNPGLTLLGLVANRFNPHSTRQRETLARLFEEHGAHVVRAKISTRSAIPEALAAGVPVWRLSKTAAREASAEVCAVFDLLWAKLRAGQPMEVTA